MSGSAPRGKSPCVTNYVLGWDTRDTVASPEVTLTHTSGGAQKSIFRKYQLWYGELGSAYNKAKAILMSAIKVNKLNRK